MRFYIAIATLLFVSCVKASGLDLELGLEQTLTPVSENTGETRLDKVDVYMIPLEDFPEDFTSIIAKSMSKDMHLWVKATLKLGSLDVSTLPGTNQLISEDIIEKSQTVLRKLPEASGNTYFLLLTTKDINSRVGGTRFQFSTHMPELHTSVISLARMFNYVDDQPILDATTQTRLYKMIKRSIGELHLGWKRSTNIEDIMYSPIMGVQDLDDIGMNHVEPLPKPDRPKASQNQLINTI